MNDIQLSPHFKLSEFTKSATAKARKIDNTPSEQAIKNLKALCINVLEPLREQVKQPITIGSGYRSPKLNAAVGGVKNSQHRYGEAADISAPTHDANGNPLTEAQGQALLHDWFMELMDGCFDQLIWERATKGSKHHWIHVSYKEGHNRQYVIRSLTKNKS